MFDARLVNISGVAFPCSRWQMDSLVPGGVGLEGGQGWLVFGVLNSGTIGKLGCIARLKTFIGCVLG